MIKEKILIYVNMETIESFLAPTGAQGEGMYMCVRLSVIFFNLGF